MVVQGTGAVLGQDQNIGQTGIDTVTEGKVNNAVLPGEWHRRFSPFLRKNTQALTLTTGQDYGNCAAVWPAHAQTSLFEFLLGQYITGKRTFIANTIYVV
jgi:hypothetical protein